MFPPHPFAETQVMPDQVEEHIRVLAHGRNTTAPPFACDYDTMTLDEFCALFTIRGWKHRATIQSVFRAHQHNRHAGPASVHILTLEAFTSQADSIPCCACGVSKPRKHLDRLKKGSCPVTVADQTGSLPDGMQPCVVFYPQCPSCTLQLRIEPHTRMVRLWAWPAPYCLDHPGWCLFLGAHGSFLRLTIETLKGVQRCKTYFLEKNSPPSPRPTTKRTYSIHALRTWGRDPTSLYK